MIILGIDPGTTRIGYSIIEYLPNSTKCLKYGILNVLGSEQKERIESACQTLNLIIRKYNPDSAAIERLFFTKNQKTVMAVSEMRGAIILTLAQKDIPIKEFTPLEVKQAVSGYGRAGKEQVEKMVRLIAGLKDPVRPDDAADAIAIAICCAHSIVF